jgi:ADP-heptose:LPS heptosyltransferase
VPLQGLKYPRFAVILSRLLELLFTPLAFLTKKPTRNLQPRRILIVEPFNLGDLISLSVMLDPLRRRFATAEIHLLVKPAGKTLYKNDQRIAMIHSFEFPWTSREKKFLLGRIQILALIKMIRKLRNLAFDIGIDTRGDIRSQILMVVLGCRIRAGFTNYLCSNLKIRGFLLSDNAGHLPPQQRCLINLAVLRVLGCENAEPRLRPISLRKSKDISKPLRVLCHPGAGWVYRLWKADRWATLIGKILESFDAEILVAGNKTDLALLEEIRSQVSGTVAFVSTSLEELQAFIQGADLMVCLDSGPMHIAAACDLPLVALFGPGFKEIWKPYSFSSCIIDHQDLYPCAPCLQKRCVLPDANCMDAITPEEVFEKVSEMIPDVFKRKSTKDKKRRRTESPHSTEHHEVD